VAGTNRFRAIRSRGGSARRFSKDVSSLERTGRVVWSGRILSSDSTIVADNTCASRLVFRSAWQRQRNNDNGYVIQDRTVYKREVRDERERREWRKGTRMEDRGKKRKRHGSGRDVQDGDSQGRRGQKWRSYVYSRLSFTHQLLEIKPGIIGFLLLSLLLNDRLELILILLSS